MALYITSKSSPSPRIAKYAEASAKVTSYRGYPSVRRDFYSEVKLASDNLQFFISQVSTHQLFINNYQHGTNGNK